MLYYVNSVIVLGVFKLLTNMRCSMEHKHTNIIYKLVPFWQKMVLSENCVNSPRSPLLGLKAYTIVGSQLKPYALCP